MEATAGRVNGEPRGAVSRGQRRAAQSGSGRGRGSRARGTGRGSGRRRGRCSSEEGPAVRPRRQDTRALLLLSSRGELLMISSRSPHGLPMSSSAVAGSSSVAISGNQSRGASQQTRERSARGCASSSSYHQEARDGNREGHGAGQPMARRTLELELLLERLDVGGERLDRLGLCAQHSLVVALQRLGRTQIELRQRRGRAAVEMTPVREEQFRASRAPDEPRSMRGPQPSSCY